MDEAKVQQAVRAWRGRFRGPFGCLLILVLCILSIPILIVVSILAIWKREQIKRVFRAQVEAERTAVEARPAAMLVRAMAVDETFTRDEALQAGVPAAAGMTSADVFDDARRRGWIDRVRSGPSGEIFAVTASGREAAAAVLGEPIADAQPRREPDRLGG